MTDVPRSIGGAELAALGAELADVTAPAGDALMAIAARYRRTPAFVLWVWTAAIVEIPSPRRRPSGADIPVSPSGRHRAAENRTYRYELDFTT